MNDPCLDYTAAKTYPYFSQVELRGLCFPKLIAVTAPNCRQFSVGGLHSHTDAVVCVGVGFHGVRGFPIPASDIYPSGAFFLTSSVIYIYI